MTKISIIQKLDDWIISVEQACEGLDRSIRTIRRYLKRYRLHWPPWLIHRLKGRPSNNQSHHWKLDWLRELLGQKRFEWFWPTLLAEKLQEIYWFSFNRESLRLRMIERWYWLPRQRKRKITRVKRERRPNEWMLLQFDGSYHDWFENWEEVCLLAAVDDATGKVKHLRFTTWESLQEVVAFWKEYMELYGKPQAIYVDCHATYKVNHPTDQFDREMRTRFLTAMQQLWIAVIYSKCPQGKWRVERWFWVHQDRLVKEMRLAGIKDIVAWEKFIDEYYAPKHNKKFSVEARVRWDFHVPMTENEKNNLDWYFAKICERQLKRDWTIWYKNIIYQIHKWQKLTNGRKVTVKETLSGELQLLTGIYPLSFDKVRHR